MSEPYTVLALSEPFEHADQLSRTQPAALIIRDGL
jgi:hypothetical protein